VVQLVFFLAVGVLLLVFLAFLAWRGRAEGAAVALVEARQAVATLQMELLPPSLVRRIFAREDLRFVRSHGTPEIEELFLKERKRIAILWLDRLTTEIQLLRRLHLGAARFYARLSVKAELSLAWDFAVLLLGCRLLRIAFAMGGPYAAPRMVETVAETATRICEVSREALAFLSRPDMPKLGDASADS